MSALASIPVTQTQASVAEPPHTLSPAQALTALEAQATGLTTAQAQERLKRYGPNTLPRGRRDGPLLLLWRQINNPLIWVLLASGVVAMLVDWHGDGIKNGLVILGVVGLNSIIGFVQEFKAGRAIEALSRMVPQNVSTLRDGRTATLPAAELVPGDIVLLASGDKVPADVRLLELRNLQIDEAALTGESVPVPKQLDPVESDAPLGDRLCLAFAGTIVTYGTATAVVFRTGAGTELGRISAMLKETTELQTPLTRALAGIGRYITVGILALTALMLVIGTYRTMHAAGVGLWEAFRETVIFGIALAVGAIPEGLPAIVTIALAIGVQRMAQRRAVVRRLPAVETLGSTTVICSDKTGTLTRNQMTVQALILGGQRYEITGVGYEPKGELRQEGRVLAAMPGEAAHALVAGALCNDATLAQVEGCWTITGDPTEAALAVAAEKLGAPVEPLRRRHRRVDVVPFESENQFMATLHDWDDTGRRIFVKGAPEVVAKRCAGVELEALHREVETLARQGMRVLAVAEKIVPAGQSKLEMEDVGGLRFLGLLGLIDPPREEAIAAVRACHAAGITVKMITGDHRATAAAIGAQLGILSEGGALTGAELAQMDDAGLRDAVGRVNVFARVAPEHKLRLVRALQRNQQVVAMTGDGVNDAPALKQANIGVAMGITGTAAAKEAAAIVLTDDNFASIAAAVEEGRRVYDNLIKSLAFVLPTNLGLALIFLVAVAFFPFDSQTRELLLPLSPVQLLWINLVATVALALPLAFEAREPDVMRRPPRKPEAPVLSAFVIMRTALVAILMAGGAVALFQWEYRGELARGVAPGVALREAQTLAVTAVILFQIFYLLNCRSLRDSIFAIGLTSNRAVFLGIGMLVLLQLGFVYLPPLQRLFGSSALGWDAWLTAVGLGILILPVISLEKWLRRRRG